MGTDTAPLNFRIPKDVKDVLEQVAHKEEISEAALVRRAIRFYLEQTYGIKVDTYMQHGGKRDTTD